jgi:ABC-type transport system involved in multi-copper enzyme maturation permease subunit
MLWHMTKRELLDHFSSLRFAFTVGLVTLLMLVNALVFVNGDYDQRLSNYDKEVARVRYAMGKSAEKLRDLARNGPVDLYKKPSPFSFVATGQEEALPLRIQANEVYPQWGHKYGDHYYAFVWPWKLEYVQDTYRKDSAFGMLVSLDWVFIVGIVISFVAILFTFDAVSGERERGTLALVMSNSVSRFCCLLGKFLGAFIAIAIPLLIGILLNLLIIVFSNMVEFSVDVWLRVLLMVALSLVYVAIFIGIGLVVSSRSRQSSTSLLVLLVLWVGLVVLIPNTLGSLAGIIKDVPDSLLEQARAQLGQISQEFWGKSVYKGKQMFEFGSPMDNPPDPRALKRWADFMRDWQDMYTGSEREGVKAQFRQVEFARGILHISPTSIYRYAMEALSDTGFVRHKQFVRAVQQYRQQFISFIKDMDAADSESFHVYPVKEGLSEKPVLPDAIPRFSEIADLGTMIRTALFDIGLLILIVLLSFMVSYLAFLRCDVK